MPHMLSNSLRGKDFGRRLAGIASIHYGFSIFDFFSLMSRDFSAWWTRKQENGRMAEMPTSTLNMSKCSSRIIQVILKELFISNISIGHAHLFHFALILSL